MAAVRGTGHPATTLPGGEPHLAHQPPDTSARMSPALPAQLGVNARRAVDPSAGREDAADMPAQLGFRLGPVLDNGDRGQPSAA
jgi:hypothetical protein